MRHLKLSEIHDHPGFPSLLRNLVTGALEAMWGFGNTYKPILPRLRNALDQAGTCQVLDLCSGSGGPWLQLAKELQREQRFSVEVLLSDKYPNRAAFERAHATEHRVGFEARSVDAVRVPVDLAGFRTIFSSFHHFRAEEASAMLGNAVECNQGIGVFEAARPAPLTLLAVCFVPVITLLLAPSIRPFRWSRLLWTYLVPVVPFVLWYDGVISCLRAYSIAELNAMVRDLASNDYEWQVGEEQSGWLPVTYLIGCPKNSQTR